MSEKPKILFVCIENSCRSQMAEGFARHLAGEKIEAFSSGSHPSHVSPMAIEVMQEKGIDISKQKSKGFEDLPYNKFDYIVSMGCGVVCPAFPAKKTIEWQIENPAGSDLNKMRRIRDQIENQVKDLLGRISLKNTLNF